MVSSPHYQTPRRDFILFKLIAYPLVQLYLGIVLLGAAVGFAVAGTWVSRAGVGQLMSAPARIFEATAWTVGLASNTPWILVLWLLAVINHLGLFLLQYKCPELLDTGERKTPRS